MRRPRLESVCLALAGAAALAALPSSSAAQGSPSEEGMLVSIGHQGPAYVRPLPVLRARAVAAHRFRSAMVEGDGSVAVWDYTGTVARPFEGVHKSVAVGESHVLALLEDGTVQAWCANIYDCGAWGSTTVPDDLGRCDAIAAGHGHSVAIAKYGVVRTWGLDDRGQCCVPPGLLPATAVAAGEAHTLVLQANHEVRGFGDDTWGQSGATIGGAIAIACGGWHSLALLADGTVVAWGRNDRGQCAVPADLGTCVAIAAGENHSVALRSDGVVRAWGENSLGQCAIPADLGYSVAIAAGSIMTLCVSRDCDGDGVDDYDTSAGPMADCDGDQAPDRCDTRRGVDQDLNHDGRPDECEERGVVLCTGDAGRCPCGAGAADAGCPNSRNPEGARLWSYGFSSISCDETLLHGEGMPDNSSVVYYQGTSAVAGGLGLPFGDGLRCVSGSIIWLGRTFNQSGRSMCPPLDTNLSTLGRIADQGPCQRWYQAWYRDAAPEWCTPMRHNFTNALLLNWVP